MNAPVNLKELEKRAYRSTYQDGLRDIYYGLVVIFATVFLYHPASGYSALNILLALIGLFLLSWLIKQGKKYITVPRLGQVKFGEIRRKKNLTRNIILGIFIALQVGLVVITTLGWFNPGFGQKVGAFLGKNNIELLVPLIGSLMVFSGMLVMSHYSDFQRGYYISILMAVAVFLMIMFNQPLYPVLIGVLIIVPGIVLLVRFLKQYPLHDNEDSHE